MDETQRKLGRVLRGSVLFVLLFSGRVMPALALDAFQESSGQVVMSAERYDGKVSRDGKNWVLETSKTGYTGSGYMRALPNTGATRDVSSLLLSPELVFNVVFATTGTYYVWARGQAAGGADDSIHAGLDGQVPASADRLSGFGTGWTWKRDTMDAAPATLVVSAPGLHTIHIFMREDGVAVDKLVLRTSSSTTAPSSSIAESGRVTVDPSPDTTPPVISDVTAGGITATSASITWTTDEPADSQVEYGTTTAYGLSTPLDPALVTSHAQPLTGLSAGTLYHYRVNSRNAANLLATSADQTFTTAAVPPALAYQESGGQVVMQAETFDANIARNSQSWVRETSMTGASGGAYLRALPNTGASFNTGYVTSSPELVFNVNCTTIGTYYVWIRGSGASGNDDSLHAGFDGAGPASADRISGFPTGWTWKRDTMDGVPATLVIATPGVHTIHLWMREDGFRADKILLRTSSSSTAPSGTGPAESLRVPISSDTTPPVISDVTAGGITATSASITWTTDEPADSQVEYGTTTAYGLSTPLDPALVTSHAQPLTGLSAGTLYHYRVNSRNAANLLATSADQTFTTAAGVDTTPPAISSIVASGITTAGATITWTTDEPADSQVEYGQTPSYGQVWPASPDPALTQTHSLTLSGLAAGTRYNFRVRSMNAVSLTSTSANQAFETLELSPQSGMPEQVVGFNRIVVSANSDALLTVPFNRRREGALTVATVTGTGVTVTDTLIAGAFAGSYCVRLTSGAGEGLWSTITGNGTNSIDLANGHVLSFVQPGDTFNVYRHHTLGSMFPSSLYGVSFTNGTQVLLYENNVDAMTTNPLPSKVATWSGGSGGQWTGSGVDNGTLLLPETRFVLRNTAAQQLIVYTHGGVPDYKVKILIAPAGDLVTGTGYPVPVVLNGSGLEGDQRQVLLYDNGASGQNKPPSKTATYLTSGGGQWTGAGVTGNESLNASESFTLRLPAGEIEDTVTMTKPYD